MQSKNSFLCFSKPLFWINVTFYGHQNIFFNWFNWVLNITLKFMIFMSISESNKTKKKSLNRSTLVTWSLSRPLIGQSTSSQNWVHPNNRVCVDALHFDPWWTLNWPPGQHWSHDYFPELSLVKVPMVLIECIPKQSLCGFTKF